MKFMVYWAPNKGVLNFIGGQVWDNRQLGKFFFHDRFEIIQDKCRCLKGGSDAHADHCNETIIVRDRKWSLNIKHRGLNILV